MTTFSLLRDRASRRTLATVPSSPATGRSFTKISFEGVIVTMTPWVSSWLSVAFGRSTSAAGCTMAEVVIMKMMRSTRNTSVSGVTLISATIRPFVCVLSAMRAPRARERFEDAIAADPQRRVDALDASLEVVVGDDGNDADGEAERRRDQRLGDASCHDAEATGAHQ